MIGALLHPEESTWLRPPQWLSSRKLEVMPLLLAGRHHVRVSGVRDAFLGSLWPEHNLGVIVDHGCLHADLLYHGVHLIVRHVVAFGEVVEWGANELYLRDAGRPKVLLEELTLYHEATVPGLVHFT